MVISRLSTVSKLHDTDIVNYVVYIGIRINLGLFEWE